MEVQISQPSPEYWEHYFSQGAGDCRYQLRHQLSQVFALHSVEIIQDALQDVLSEDQVAQLLEHIGAPDTY